MNKDDFSREFQAALNIFLDVLDCPDIQKEISYGFIPGIDDKLLYSRVKRMSDLPFKICFISGFAVGKYTLISAILRQDVYITSNPMRPEYDKWIKTIQYGQENMVLLRPDSSAESNETIKLSFEEYYMIEKRDDIKKLCEKYRYADFYLNNDFLKLNKIEIYDIPRHLWDMGLSEITEVLDKSHAIIYCMSAVRPCSHYDREFTHSYRMKRFTENLFFAINHINLIESEEELNELKNYVKTQLKDLFTSVDGSFDEELFDARVFFTDPHGSLMARTNRPIEMFGNSIMIDDSSTGISELEKALLEFKDQILQNGKIPPRYMLVNLADIYLTAVKHVDEYLIELEENSTEKNDIENFYQVRKQYLSNIDKLYITLCILYRHIYSQELTEEALINIAKSL